ncbi:MAG: peptidoglycan-binding domain-containing protein [bacterium]|nr:peptidoglycan-binding domain-containing protein [bacterium]MDZ4284544.1 peptidoglycan-binding domain-containing protein [Patescibacteria group bacterium]
MTQVMTQYHPILRAALLAASVAVLVFAMGFALIPLAASANNGGIVFPSCPIQAAENRIVVALDPSQFLYGAGSESGPFLVNIPSGTYDITLASFDNHSQKGGQGQESERWQLKLLDSSGVLLGVTALINDLADADDVLVEKVNEGFMISADVAKLRPFHPDEGNSIRPLCAAFDLVSAGTGTDTGGGTATNTATTTTTIVVTSTSSSTESSASAVNNTSTAGGSSSASCGGCGGIGGGGVTVTPLVVSEEQAQWIGNVIVVTWKTNIPATSRVYYGTQSVEPLLLDEHLGYATGTMLATTTVTEHTVEILEADPTKTYYLRPASQETPEQNFRITGKELSLLPPVSTGPTVAPVGAGSATGVEAATLTRVLIERSGASRTCSAYLTSFIRPGATNNYADVAKLQLFLWQYEGFSDLRITGVYDESTRRAVETFQIRYAADVLIPWGLTSPTGHVYLTTQKKINELYCSRALGIKATFGLSTAADEEIQAYRAALQAERRRQGSPTWEPAEPRVGRGETQGAIGISREPAPEETNQDKVTQVAPARESRVPLVVEDGEDSQDGETTSPRPSPFDGAALIVEEIGDKFATATRNGLIGALFAGFSGPSAPTFLGILSLVLLVVGALMLARSLRSGGPNDPNRKNTPPPPPPFSGSGGGLSQPRTSSSSFGEERGKATMPPPPVQVRTSGSPITSGSPSASVFEMPPASGVRDTARVPGWGAGPQPVASLLRGSVGETLRSPVVGPIASSVDKTDKTAHTETVPFLSPQPVARAISSTSASAPSSRPQPPR